MSAFLVIWPPQVSDTAESLIACLLGWPSAPLGWNASNSALRSSSVSWLVSVSDADLHGGRTAAADDHHRFGVLAQCLAEHLFDLLRDCAVACGGHRHLGAALEVDAEGEAADHDAGDGDGDDRVR